MQKTALLLSLISLVIAFTANESNLASLRKDAISLRENQTIKTSDDASYIQPAINYLNGKGLKSNFEGKGSYFLRPPGYSFFFIAFRSFLSSENTLKAIKFTQLIFWGFSVYLLFFISFYFLKSKKLATTICLIYGISQISTGFLYYTLTEGITPALLILYFYLLIKAKDSPIEQSKKIFYTLASLTFAILFIIRPALGLFILLIPISIYLDYRRNPKILFFNALYCSCIGLSLMLWWQIRNYRIADQYVGLHPIYYSENSNNCFRPAHKAFWDLCKGWGIEGAKFHKYSTKFWASSIKGDTSVIHLDKLMNCFPDHAKNYFGTVKIKEALKSYQLAILDQKYYYDNNLAMQNKVPKNELIAIRKFKSLSNSYKKHFWYHYYIISPVKVFYKLAFHSNLSLYIFQHSLRGHILMEFWRFICFTIHALCFTILLIAPFLLNRKSLEWWLAVTLNAYVVYLIFIQRGIEERYTLPILPLVLVISAISINRKLPTLANTLLKKLLALLKRLERSWG